jgi:hypothetical protein
MQRKIWYSILRVGAMPLSVKNLLLRWICLFNLVLSSKLFSKSQVKVEEQWFRTFFWKWDQMEYTFQCILTHCAMKKCLSMCWVFFWFIVPNIFWFIQYQNFLWLRVQVPFFCFIKYPMNQKKDLNNVVLSFLFFGSFNLLHLQNLLQLRVEVLS